MNPLSTGRLDMQIVVTGIVLLVLGVVLITIAAILYKRVRELLSATSKSERELQIKISSKTKEASVLHELTTVISQSLKIKEIFTPALAKVLEITGADAGCVYAVGRSSGFFELSVTEKIPAELFLKLANPLNENEIAQIAIHRAVKGIDLTMESPGEISATALRHGLKYALIIPIAFKDSVLGAIAVFFKKKKAEAQPEEMLSLLRSLGLEIGVALNNAILFSKVENAKQEWESTFDSIKDMMYIHDKDMRIIRCNTAFMEYVGLKPQDIIGRKYFELFPKASGPLALCSAEIQESGKNEVEFFDNSTGRTFLINTYPVFDKHGEYLYAVHSAKNITEIKQARLDNEELLISAITTLVSAIDAKSPWTKGHSERVTYYATEIAGELRMSVKEIENLTLAGLLHDIGKIGTYDAVLDKPSRLTKEEFELVKKHPMKGVDILTPIKQLKDVIPTVKHHHERYDGTGYPDGLKGEDIPFSARILTVADSFDAMTSDRPYRKASGKDYAISELKKFAGIYYDPQIVRILMKVIER